MRISSRYSPALAGPAKPIAGVACALGRGNMHAFSVVPQLHQFVGLLVNICSTFPAIREIRAACQEQIGLRNQAQDLRPGREHLEFSVGGEAGKALGAGLNIPALLARGTTAATRSGGERTLAPHGDGVIHTHVSF